MARVRPGGLAGRWIARCLLRFIARNHRRADRARRPARLGRGPRTPTLVISERSYEAVLHAAGGAVGAGRPPARRLGPSPVSAPPPPSPSAAQRPAMGFCLFNNTAVAAAPARRGGGRAGTDPRLGRPPRERDPGRVPRAREVLFVPSTEGSHLSGDRPAREVGVGGKGRRHTAAPLQQVPTPMLLRRCRHVSVPAGASTIRIPRISRRDTTPTGGSARRLPSPRRGFAAMTSSMQRVRAESRPRWAPCSRVGPARGGGGHA